MPKRERLKDPELTFLGVDFLDLDVRKVTGETSYFKGNGFWYVKTYSGQWIRLEYANKEERTAIREEIKHKVKTFERRFRCRD